MLRYRLIPTLLLKNGGLVKTTRFKKPVYIGDPINAVKIFNEKEVDELLLLDITATLEHKGPDFNKIEEILSEAFMPIGYGGGITKLCQIERLFRIGVEKVILNSVLFSDMTLLKKASDIFGSQSIVVSIDVKKDIWGRQWIYSGSGTKKQLEKIFSYLKKTEENGAGEYMINSIDREGTMEGYDLDLIKLVSSGVSVPVIASGGAGSLNDFSDAILYSGASAVAAGAMFVFQGVHRAVLITYPKYSDLEEILNPIKL